MTATRPSAGATARLPPAPAHPRGRVWRGGLLLPVLRRVDAEHGVCGAALRLCSPAGQCLQTPHRFLVGISVAARSFPKQERSANHCYSSQRLPAGMRILADPASGWGGVAEINWVQPGAAQSRFSPFEGMGQKSPKMAFAKFFGVSYLPEQSEVFPLQPEPAMKLRKDKRVRFPGVHRDHSN